MTTVKLKKTITHKGHVSVRIMTMDKQLWEIERVRKYENIKYELVADKPAPDPMELIPKFDTVELIPEVSIVLLKQTGYEEMSLTQLRKLAKEKGVKSYNTMQKEEIISKL